MHNIIKYRTNNISENKFKETVGPMTETPYKFYQQKRCSGYLSDRV